MYRCLTLLIIFFFSLTTKAQINRYTSWDFRDSLRAVGIDSLIIYSRECNGEAYSIVDTCYLQDPSYLMWHANGKFYLKRFDQCHRYKILEFDSLKPYQLYYRNKNLIDKEKIEPPTYTQYLKKGNKLIKHENIVVVDHDCFYNFSFCTSNRIVEKKVSWFNLTNQDFGDGKNINYSRNQRTKLKQLVDTIDDLILQLQSDKKFQPE